jgi:hypothetical protein
MAVYRPQFAYDTPKGFRDEQFHYTFFGFNTPMLVANIAAGAILSNIPLVLQTDAPFLWRGVKVSPASSAFANPQLNMQFKDAWGNYLSNKLVPAALYMPPVNANVGGFAVVPLEPEVRCPAGGIIWLWLQNPTGSPVAPPQISLYGVKRYRVERV